MDNRWKSDWELERDSKEMEHDYYTLDYDQRNELEAIERELRHREEVREEAREEEEYYEELAEREYEESYYQDCVELEEEEDEETN